MQGDPLLLSSCCMHCWSWVGVQTLLCCCSDDDALLDELDLSEEEGGSGEAERRREARERLRKEAEVTSYLYHIYKLLNPHMEWQRIIQKHMEPVIFPVNPLAFILCSCFLVFIYSCLWFAFLGAFCFYCTLIDSSLTPGSSCWRTSKVFLWKWLFA